MKQRLLVLREKCQVFNLRLLSARLCFMLGLRSFLPTGVILVLFAATSDLDLGCLLKHSGFTVMHCFGESGCVCDRPDSDARMVTWGDIVGPFYSSAMLQKGLRHITFPEETLRTFVPGRRPSRAFGFLNVLWTWLRCSTFSLKERKFSLHFPQRWIPFLCWGEEKKIGKERWSKGANRGERGVIAGLYHFNGEKKMRKRRWQQRTWCFM